MGKVAIDFKINNTHNNTGQLLIFIYLFITSYPSLLVYSIVQPFSSDALSALLFIANVLFLFHTSQVILCLHNFIVSSFCLFHWYISEIDLL